MFSRIHHYAPAPGLAKNALKTNRRFTFTAPHAENTTARFAPSTDVASFADEKGINY
jgi:hypothetical protein